MKLYKFILSICFFGLLLNVDVHASELFIAAPGVGTGTTNAVAPFAFEEVGAASVRYQQVYSADEFRNEIPQGGVISGLYLVTDQQTGRGFDTAWQRVEIDISVTSRGPDSLSPVFMENEGANLVTVRQGFMSFSAMRALGMTSRIDFQVPYTYDPADGNLLMEIRIYGPSDLPPDPGSRASRMWAADNPFGPDSVSRVVAYDVNATSGIADSIGLSTLFAVTPVPEPSIIILALAGVCVIRLWAKRRHRNYSGE